MLEKAGATMSTRHLAELIAVPQNHETTEVFWKRINTMCTPPKNMSPEK